MSDPTQLEAAPGAVLNLEDISGVSSTDEAPGEAAPGAVLNLGDISGEPSTDEAPGEESLSKKEKVNVRVKNYFKQKGTKIAKYGKLLNPFKKKNIKADIAGTAEAAEAGVAGVAAAEAAEAAAEAGEAGVAEAEAAAEAAAEAEAEAEAVAEAEAAEAAATTEEPNTIQENYNCFRNNESEDGVTCIERGPVEGAGRKPKRKYKTKKINLKSKPNIKKSKHKTNKKSKHKTNKKSKHKTNKKFKHKTNKNKLSRKVKKKDKR